MVRRSGLGMVLGEDKIFTDSHHHQNRTTILRSVDTIG